MSAGKSVRLFLADGTPGGLLTAEIMNWTGHVAAAPRSELPALLERPEAGRTGIYLLIGDNPDSLGGTLTYVGEGDAVSKRLVQHARPEEQQGKDFWQRAIVLTSKDANLTKAHARYLESRFIELATQAGRTTLINGTAPPRPALPEADESDMEYFVSQAKIVLPVLGVNILRSGGDVARPTTEAATAAMPSSPTFALSLKKEGVTAHAQEIDGEFTVLQGSLARNKWVGTADQSYRLLREKLEKDGTLSPSGTGTTMRFERDHVFASPSAAAAIVAGRAANGRKNWKLPDGVSYGGWQDRGLGPATAGLDLDDD